MLETTPPEARRPGRRVGAAAVAALLLGGAALAAPAVVAAAPAPLAAQAAGPSGTITGGTLDWGVKASFRSYIRGPIAKGTVATSAGATTGPDGTFRFGPAAGTVAADGSAADVRAGGTVAFSGHGGLLELSISNPEVVVSGTSGTLVADVVSKALEGASAGLPVTYTDVDLATLDLTGKSLTPVGGRVTLADVPATLTEEGAPAFADFYAPGTALDPLTLSAAYATPVTYSPRVTVGDTTIDPAGQTVTVTGSGFDPAANPSLRPPVPVGSPAGVYVVFGQLADTWRPSAGAPTSARTVLDQKWALPAASKTAAEAAFGPNAQYVVLGADGTFSTTLRLAPSATPVEGRGYAVATYAAGGTPNAAQETATPVTFGTTPTEPEPEPGVTPVDLATTIATPLTVTPGSAFSSVVTVTNRGTAAAGATTTTVLALGVGEVTGTGGGTAEGQLVTFRTPGLAAGASATFTLDLVAPAGFSFGVTGAFTTSVTPDPNLFNDIGLLPTLTA